jgi:hypothetical protein
VNIPQEVIILCYICKKRINSNETCEMRSKEGKMKYRHLWDCLQLKHKVVEIHGA